MSSKLKKIARKIGSLICKYIDQYEKEKGSCGGFIYVTHECGEIFCYADNLETLKKEVSAMRKETI
jgi:hypothetical protein